MMKSSSAVCVSRQLQSEAHIGDIITFWRIRLSFRYGCSPQLLHDGNRTALPAQAITIRAERMRANKIPRQDGYTANTFIRQYPFYIAVIIQR